MKISALLPLSVSILFLVSLYYGAMFVLVRAMSIQTYYPSGNEPKSLLEEFHISQAYPFLLCAEAVNTQVRIDMNSKLNSKKAKAIETALYIAISAPIASVVIFLILKYFKI